jgi:membrane-anchored glycerophosphoryl diester phosphodiesterase (GDPDase)
MVKFDMGAAWDDTLQLLKSHTALVGTIAGVFLFLPALAFAWFGPIPIEPPAGADFDQVMATFRESFRQMIPGQVVIALATMIGSVAILRLWLSRTGVSVGEALTFGLMLFPTMLAAQILSGIGIGIGFILLIIPGLYLIGRLALVAPAIADRAIYNPIEAIRTSWDLTRNNGWAVFFFLFLVNLVIVIAALIIGGIVAVIFGSEPGIGRMLGGFVEAAFGAIGGLVSVAISAAAYRQLALRTSSDVFQ